MIPHSIPSRNATREELEEYARWYSQLPQERKQREKPLDPDLVKLIEKYRTKTQDFKVADRVKIAGGNLSGATGIIIEVRRGDGKCVIRLDIPIERKIIIEHHTVAPDYLQKLVEDR